MPDRRKKARVVRGHDMSIQIKAVILRLEARPDFGGNKTEIGFPAGGENNRVHFHCFSIGELQAVGGKFFYNRSMQVNFSATRQAEKITFGYLSRFAEGVDFNRQFGGQADPGAEGRAEPELKV